MEFVQARNYQPGRAYGPPVLVVLHTVESSEHDRVAESVAGYFAATSRKSSCHIVVDNNSAVRCVKDEDTAYGAPGANARGLHLEMAGKASQLTGDWQDPYSVAMLKLAAVAVATWCIKYKIPVKRLSQTELKRYDAGIIGHHDATLAFPPNAGHWDPGNYFPWSTFLAQVQSIVSPKPKPPVVVPGYKPPPYPTGNFGPNIAHPKTIQLQDALNVAKFGNFTERSTNYGPKTQAAVAAFHRSAVGKPFSESRYDPAIGPKGWAALFTYAYGRKK